MTGEDQSWDGEERRTISWREEIDRLDRGQEGILARLDQYEKYLQQDRTALNSLLRSQKEQTEILTTIRDYFAFGRIGKRIVIGMAGVGAAIFWMVTQWKTFAESLKALLLR